MKFKSILIAIILLLGSVNSLRAQDQETINLILKELDFQPIQSIVPKLDNMVNMGETPEQQALIAAYIFDYYYSSKIMGYESLAMYIADNYFINKKLKYPTDDGFFMLNIFAEFNRSSLLGLKAPDMTLQDSKGQAISLSDLNSEYKVLYFYDDQCSTCKIQTPLLLKYLSSVKNQDITLVRIFTDNTIERWQNYLSEEEKYEFPQNIKVVDLIDAEMASGFHKLYAVLSTPQLFLIDKENTIIGRKLDVESLAHLLNKDMQDAIRLNLLISELFATIVPEGESPDTSLVYSTIDILYNKCKRGERSFQQQMLHSIYQYLKSNPLYEFQCGAIYLAEKYIVNKPDIWEGFKSWKYTENSFIEETKAAINKFNLNKLGSQSPNITIYNKWGRKKQLHDIDGNRILYFFDSPEKNDWQTLNKFAEVWTNTDLCSYEPIVIYIGDDKKVWKSIKKQKEVSIYRSKLSKKELSTIYGISPLPSIYLINSEKIIIGKDITIEDLKELSNVR